MKYNPDIHHRRSIRLKGCDYSRNGACFLSICTQNRECLFGEMAMNGAGRMVQAVWNALPIRFDHIELDGFVVMPNHIHGIFMLHGGGEPCVRPGSDHDCKSGEHKQSSEHKVRPYGTLPNKVGRIIQAFKSITTHKYTIGVKQNDWPRFAGKLWQRNYYEHIVRNENELKPIREYIQYNPMKWEFDRKNPDLNVGTVREHPYRRTCNHEHRTGQDY